MQGWTIVYQCDTLLLGANVKKINNGEMTMTKAEETHLSNFIQQERAEGLLASNTIFAITLHRKIFGIKYNELRGIFIKYGLKDEQGNTIGPHGVLSTNGLWERHTTDKSGN